jgi:hypothetical protein
LSVLASSLGKGSPAREISPELVPKRHKARKEDPIRQPQYWPSPEPAAHSDPSQLPERNRQPANPAPTPTLPLDTGLSIP